MYDIFFLSNGEPEAESNWKYVKDNWPWARRVDGIKGIAQAHQECAKRSLTTNFFVVDADNIPDEDFPFDIKLPSYDLSFVHVWYARNPVTEPYGWGGVKLFPRKEVLEFKSEYLDFTMSFGLKVIPEPKSYNRFNTSPFDSWRSAVREAYKLTKAGDNESLHRLGKWLNADCEFKDYIKDGAALGSSMVGTDLGINDWDALRRLFDEKQNS